MTRRLYPARLTGTVAAPPSKSAWHRELICRFLAGQPLPQELSGADVSATLSGLRVLRQGGDAIDCGASGATLRFLLPLAMALGRTGLHLTGTPRLLERPLSAPYPVARENAGYRITEPLTPGRYALRGDETSQTVSGLLMALPLLAEPSELVLTTPLVSRAYVDMTLDALRRHGVTVLTTETGWRIPASQVFQPDESPVEGDWSAGGWWLAVNALQGGGVTVTNLPLHSSQPDRVITGYLQELPETVDVSQTPDLLPALALLAAMRPQTTRFTGGAFLRRKESDRLHTVAAVLAVLGVAVEELPDGLTVVGGRPLHGGVTLDAFDDHRIAMLCGCAALFCREPVVLRGGNCVAKSYEDFWRDYAMLGGKTEELMES